MAAVWLASGSPRRRNLLQRLGFQVSVHPADVPEVRGPGEDPVAFATRLALDKASSGPDTAIVLAADTVVHLDDAVLGKPTDPHEAATHLRRLSGRWHEVTTGVCVRAPSGSTGLAVTTGVLFRELSDREIAAYVDSGEPLDKAGAYGIQGLGGALVAEVRGSWTNVMGLPVEAVVGPLEAAGAARWAR